MQKLWDYTPIHYAQWPRCNGMAKIIVKTLKHGLIVLFAMSKHAQDYDKHLPRILFGYKCEVHASTKLCPCTYASNCMDPHAKG